MCYSLKTSLISYTIGMISALVAIKTGQIPLGFLILFYTQIQLAEGIIWRGIDTNNLSLNKLGTNIAKYSLPLHLFGLGLGIYVVYKTPIPLIAGIIFFLYVCILYVYEDTSTYTFPYESCHKRECQNSNNRLVWTFPLLWYAIMTIIALSFYLFYVRNDSIISRLFVVLFFIATYLITRYLYPVETTISSLWCFISAIAAPIVVLVNYFLISKL